jgi:hypothetical protein
MCPVRCVTYVSGRSFRFNDLRENAIRSDLLFF